MKSVKLFSVIAGLALLTGCGAMDIEALRDTAAPSQGTAFTKALTTEYRALTIFESDEMKDWPDAYTFAAKGLSASRGENVLPEVLTNWSLTQEKAQELGTARAKLVQALDANARAAKPAIAAKAQVAFDCWVEQEEEAFQLADIASCRSIFEHALAQLVTPVATPTTPPVAQPSLSKNFIIYFAWDSARLDAAGLRIIDEASATAKATGNARITIVGHADRSGTPEYNTRLSLRRADAVRSALVAKGIATERTAVTALGETEPAIPTADGVREGRNRRVELTIR